MTSAYRITMALWRAPRRRSAGERLASAYTVFLVALVTVAPLVRGLGMLVADPTVAAALAPATAATPAAAGAGACMIVALCVGRVRGPVVMAPFLAYALTESSLPRTRVYGGHLLRALVGCTLAGIACGALPVLVWQAAAGPVSAMPWPRGAGMLLLGGGSGAVLAVLWLAGQVLNARACRTMAMAIAGAIAITVFVPASLPFTPLGWVASGYAAGGWSPAVLAFTALAVGAVAWILPLARTLRADVVIAQSQRWDAALAHTSHLELSEAAQAYLPVPTRGRGLRAVRGRGPLLVRVVTADGVGMLRSPARLAAGVVIVAAAGALCALAVGLASPWLGAVGGIVAYAGVGPLTDGIRHAIEAVSGMGLYGAADLTVVAAHAVLPIAVAVVVLAAAVAVSGGGVGAGAMAVLVAPASVAARLATALKPPLPVGLLMPVPTPAGDLAAVARLAWASDAVLLAGAAGAGVSVLTSAPWVAATAFLVLAAVCARRWAAR